MRVVEDGQVSHQLVLGLGSVGPSSVAQSTCSMWARKWVSASSVHPLDLA